MLNDLIKLANRLDSIGLTKEADAIDGVIRTFAGKKDDDFIALDPVEELEKYRLDKSKWAADKDLYSFVLTEGTLPRYVPSGFYKGWKKLDFKKIFDEMEK